MYMDVNYTWMCACMCVWVFCVYMCRINVISWSVSVCSRVVCVQVHVHVYIYCVCLCVWVCWIRVDMHAYLYVHACVYVYVYVHILCACVGWYVCVCICVCMYTCMYVFTCMYVCRLCEHVCVFKVCLSICVLVCLYECMCDPYVFCESLYESIFFSACACMFWVYVCLCLSVWVFAPFSQNSVDGWIKLLYLRILLIWRCSWSNYGWSGWVGLTFSAEEPPCCSVSLARLIAVAPLLRKLKSKLVVCVVLYLYMDIVLKLAFKIFWSCKFLWWLHGLHETRKEINFLFKQTFLWVVCVTGAIIPPRRID